MTAVTPETPRIQSVRVDQRARTVTVTLRNAKKGAYYMALHAWNRTSENRTKVFSPWSNIKRIVIK